MGSERQQLLLLGLLIVGVVMVGYVFGLPPLGLPSVTSLQAEAAKLREERRKLELTVQNAQLQVAKLAQIKKEREALEAQLAELSRRLPSERESAQVLRSVESLAGRAGLTVGEVKRRGVRTQELYAELPMEVAVGGGYHDILRFADQLGKLERLVTLHELELSRPTGTAPAPARGPAGPVPLGPVRAEMVAVVFQALPAAAPPAAAGSAPAPAAR